MFDKGGVNITKVEFRELQRNIAYVRKMAEELVDECCGFEADLDELYIKGQHRGKNKKYGPLVVQAPVSDDVLDQMSPEGRKMCGFDPEAIPPA